MELIEDPARWRVLLIVLNVKLLMQNGERTLMDGTAWKTLP